MRCSKCGAENRDDARFCRGCGEVLVNQRQKRKKRMLVILGVCLLLTILGVVGAMLLSAIMHRGGGSNESHGSSLEATMTKMKESNGGVLPDLYYDESRSVVHFVDGRFTDRLIADQNDAVDAVGEIASVFAIDEPARKLRCVDAETIDDFTYYRLQQFENDIPVYGCQLIVSVDGSGNATSVSGVYDANLSDDITAKLSTDEATATVFESGAYPTGEPSLEYYSSNGTSSKLCWAVECVGKTVFVDASDGGILGAESTVFTESSKGTGDDLDGGPRSFSTYRNASSKFDLLDEDRCIYAYNLDEPWSGIKEFLNLDPFIGYGQNVRYEFYNVAGSEVVAFNPYTWNASNHSYEKIYSWNTDARQPEHWNYAESMKENPSGGKYYCIRDLDTGEIVLDGLRFEMEPCQSDGKVVAIAKDDDNRWSDKNAVSAMANVQWAYDAYASLGRKGVDGLGNTKLSIWFNINWNNACSCFNGSVLQFGKGKPSLECVIHEYTHSVEQSINGLRYLGESGALAEAYSDTMAMALTDSQTWHLDKISKNRDANDPSSKSCPSYYGGEYWDHRFETMSIDDIEANQDNDHGNVHKHSTVISHAAYLMHAAGVSNEDLSQIWYRSLYHLDPNSDFYTCRYAVIAAARELGFKNNTISIIEDSFNEVGIARYDVSTMKVKPSGKIYAEDHNGNRIDEFEVQLRYAGGEFGKFRGDVACSTKTTTGIVDMASDFGGEPLIGHYFFDVYAEKAAQEFGPVITVDTNGADEIVVTLPILVANLNGNPEPDSDNLSRKLVSSFHISYDSKKWPDQSYEEWMSATYDDAGRMTRKEITGNWPVGYEGETGYSLSYTYDDKGRLSTISGTEGESYQAVFPDYTPGKLTWDVVYETGGVTSLASGLEFDDPRHVVDVCDEDGNLVSRDFLIRTGQIIEDGSLALSYDDNGRLVYQSVQSSSTGGSYVSSYEVSASYDNASRLSSIEIVDSDGKLFSRREYKYNNDGRMTKRDLFYDGGNSNLTVNQSYSYNEKGLLTSGEQNSNETFWGNTTAVFTTDNDGSIISARIEGDNFIHTYEVEYTTVKTPKGQEPFNAVDLTDPFSPELYNDLWVSHANLDPTPFDESEFLRVNRRWLELHDSSDEA